MSTRTDEDTLRGLLIVLGWEYRTLPITRAKVWYREATTEELLRVDFKDVSHNYPSCLYADTLTEAAEVERRVSGINLLGGTQDENT